MKIRSLFVALIVLSFMYLPAFVLAQVSDAVTVYPASLKQDYISWSGIVIGFIVSILTLYYAFAMTGSIVGDILRPIGVGIFFVALGYFFLEVDWGALPSAQKAVHDILFTSGYVMTLIGVLRIRTLSS